MRRADQLQQRIAAWNFADFKELRRWFDRYEADLWDRKIRQDSKSGKLRRLIDQAFSDDRAGYSKEL